MQSTVRKMQFKEIAQSMVRRNAIYIMTAGSDLTETVEEYIRTIFAYKVFFCRKI